MARKKAPDFIEAMRRNKGFLAAAEKGFKQIERGEYISLEELQIKLGDRPPVVGVLAHPCNIYRAPTRT
jgi:hypothetical protein